MKKKDEADLFRDHSSTISCRSGPLQRKAFTSDATSNAPLSTNICWRISRIMRGGRGAGIKQDHKIEDRHVQDLLKRGSDRRKFTTGSEVPVTCTSSFFVDVPKGHPLVKKVVYGTPQKNMRR